MQNSYLRETASVLAAVLAIAVTGCSPRPASPKPPLPSVRTSIAAEGSVTPTDELPGIIAPAQNVAIQTTLTEPAATVLVQEGDHVRGGQVLAQLDVSDLRSTLQANLAAASSQAANSAHQEYAGNLSIAQAQNGVRSAQSALAQAQATVATDSTNLARNQALLANGYVAPQLVQQQQTTVANDRQAVRSAQAALASAQALVQANGTLGSNGLQSAALAQARANEQQALSQANEIRVQIAKATLVSPVDGVVVNRALNPGEYPGSRQLFTVQQTDPVYAVVRGSGRQIARLRVGSPADVLVSDLSATPFHGTVAAVLNQINPGSTNFIVKVLVRNPSGIIRAGMAVQANVPQPTLHGVKIPTTAFTDDTHTNVMVVQNGKVETVHVRDAGGDGTSSIVLGLAPGTRVIADGQAGLADGQQVAAR